VKGSTFKRCGCTDAVGKPLGADCPRLKSKAHGSWYYAADLPPTVEGRRRYRRKGGFATQREAQAALTDLLDRVQKRTHVDIGKTTVSQFLEQWLAGKAKLRETTRRSYEEHLRLYLRPGLGHLRLTELSEQHIERLYTAMRQIGRGTLTAGVSLELESLLRVRAGAPAQPLTAARIRRVHATLMSALNTAVKRKQIPYNPGAHVELETGRRPRPVVWTEDRVVAWRAGGPRPKVAVWTAEQTGAFLDHIADDRLYALYHLIAFRGLRRGEAVGLPWADVDLDAATATVRQQIVQLGWETEEGEPKTASGVRVIALDADTVAVLRGHRARQSAERLQCGSAWVSTGLVFTREDGSAVHPDYVTRHFERLVRAADLPPIRLHDLRHGAATLALAGGANLKVVSEMLGHSGIAITADTYTSVLPQVARVAAEAANALVPRAHRTQHHPAAPISHPSGPENDAGPPPKKAKGQVKRGAPPGTRTPNPRIKSPLLCQLS
jgi:integrase